MDAGDDWSAADRKVLADVKTAGWHVVKVPEAEGTPGWAFSIGLHHTFGHPEVVVFGLPLEVMHEAINTLGAAVREGAIFEADTRHDDVAFAGVACAFRTVQRRWYAPFLGYATWFYRGKTFPALQCFWPDKAGRFPWEASGDSRVEQLQPLLFRTDADAARVAHLLRTLGDNTR